MSAHLQKTNHKLLRILIAVDKFKGSLTSWEAAQAIRKGIQRTNPRNISFDIVEIADGGEGSAQIFKKYGTPNGVSQYKEVECMATNPVGKQIKTSYLTCDNKAFIEMACISGLQLLAQEQRNPLHTTTYGLGELIRHAAAGGAAEITLSIGGSATNDGGTGMLQALGFGFLGTNGKPVTNQYMCGKDLEHIVNIVPPPAMLTLGDAPLILNNIPVTLKVICDVTNPLIGANGATMVYGAQKGADKTMLQKLEAGMIQYASVAERVRLRGHSVTPDNLNISNYSGTRTASDATPGAGAAGGVGFASLYFLGAELISGWSFFAELTNLSQRIAQSDLVISGEGKIDTQSMQGKVIDGVLQLASVRQKPVLLFCGKNAMGEDDKKLSGIKIYSICDMEPDESKCMSRAGKLLAALAATAIMR
ncbi:MAG: glycerate kinase [Bacteroidales bacterium]